VVLLAPGRVRVRAIHAARRAKHELGYVVLLGQLQEVLRPGHVHLLAGNWVVDGGPDAGPGGQVHDYVKRRAEKHRAQRVGVPNVGLREVVPRVVPVWRHIFSFDGRIVVRIKVVDDRHFPPVLHKGVDEVAPNKTGPAGYQCRTVVHEVTSVICIR